MVRAVSDPSTPSLYDSDDQPPLTRPGVWPIALALGIGAVGGLIFSALHVPLAWMLGPMIFNMAASVKRVPVLMPHGARVVTICLVGVFLGGSFTPELLERAGEWIISLSMLLIFVPLITLAAAVYYHKVARFDVPTATFSSAPVRSAAARDGSGSAMRADGPRRPSTTTCRAHPSPCRTERASSHPAGGGVDQSSRFPRTGSPGPAKQRVASRTPSPAGMANSWWPPGRSSTS